ncbi:NAD(P)-dependent oxidoreductase [Candidatus Bathyarchaeota archaeon]|nr:NAD(P)-dependent oxidoreductase [Candidatus Bathyarchaeota archaeon]
MKNKNELVVGFIGLGNMGLPMAENIIRAGYPLIVWNRTIQRTKSLVNMGAQVATSPSELTRRASIIFTMLPGPHEVREVVLGKKDGLSPVIDSIKANKILVDMTTNLPDISRIIEKEIHRKGGEMLDAPVSGSVKPATDGTLTILVGGKKDVLDKITPLLLTMGKNILHIGPIGSACTMKLVLNMHLATVMASFAESLAFGFKSGLEPTKTLEVINNSIMKTYISEMKGLKVINHDWSTAFSLNLMSKDLELVEETANMVRAPIPITNIIKQIYDSCISNGKGEMDFSIVATKFEEINDNIHL